MENKVVGIACTMDDHGCQLLGPEEIEVILKLCDEKKKKRISEMPTEQDVIHHLYRAYQRLVDLGWKKIIYCPKDGSSFKAIEVGSTGVFDCFYEGQWPDGSWLVEDGGELWPSRPCLYKPTIIEKD